MKRTRDYEQALVRELRRPGETSAYLKAHVKEFWLASCTLALAFKHVAKAWLKP